MNLVRRRQNRHFTLVRSLQTRPTPPARPTGAQSISQSWTFLSNHTHVLICLDRDPESIMRDVATKVGITERAVQKIVAELEAGGIIQRTKIGRRNRYTIDRRVRLRHALEAHCRVSDLLKTIS